MTNTVLILGASGKIGRNAANAFSAAGWTVRKFTRGTDMTAAAKGCDVVVNGLNPPNYHNWAKIIPEITRDVIAAAKASGAAIIIPGNVYNFGTQPAPWSESTPQVPCSRKGRIRVEMEEAYRASGVQTIILRAGNFIDPQADDDILSLVLLRALGKGTLTYPGDFDAIQAYAYLPDWGRAAVMLAELRETLGTFEDVPFPGHSFTAEEMRDRLAHIMGRRLKRGSFPWMVMRLAAPFWELARELNEMRYLWSHDHMLSGEKFSRLLPEFEPTSFEDVLQRKLVAQLQPDETMRSGNERLFAQ